MKGTITRLSWAESLELVYEGADVLPAVVIDGQPLLLHTQGLYVTERHYLVTGRRESIPRRAYLLRFDRMTGDVEQVDITPAKTQGETLDHPGGVDVDEAGDVWIPLSTSHRRGPSRICRYRVDPERPLAELTMVSSFEVDDHIGAVCCLSQQQLLGANWDSLELTVWQHDGRHVSRAMQAAFIAGGSGRIAVQDWKRWRDDTVANADWVLLGGLDKAATPATSVVQLVEIASGQGKVVAAQTLLPRDDTARPVTNEGMAVYDGRVYLLPEDVGRGAKVLRYRIERN